MPTISKPSANPVGVIIGKTEQGGGSTDTIDGGKRKGIEDDPVIARRKELLRKIGYKL